MLGRAIGIIAKSMKGASFAQAGQRPFSRPLPPALASCAFPSVPQDFKDLADALGTVHMDFVPAKRQRLKEADFELAELDWTSPTARGVRMAPKPVGKVKLIAAPESGEKNVSAKKAAKGKAKKRDGKQGDLF